MGGSSHHRSQLRAGHQATSRLARARRLTVLLATLVLLSTACSVQVQLPPGAEPQGSADASDAATNDSTGGADADANSTEGNGELSLAEQLELLEAENQAAAAAVVDYADVFGEEPNLLAYIGEQITATIIPPPDRRRPARPYVEIPEPPAPEPAAAGLISCGDRLECGFIAVPVDYVNPETSGTLQIAINVYRSALPEQRLGYLFINPGGPGASGVDMVAEWAWWGLPPEILDRFDIVGFDPRGVGQSEPRFECGVGSEQFDLLVQIDESIDTVEEIAIGDQAARLCIDSMGRVGALLHSEYVARDMDQIRRALGEEQISYLGFSYGSALGGWYASIFPDRVRAMVVDGASDPLANPRTSDETIQYVINSYGQFEERLDAALKSCRNDSCPIHNGGDPHGYWYDMVDKFDIVLDAKGGNGDAVFFAIIGHLYSEDLWPDLHQAIYELAEFDDPSRFIEAIEFAGTVDEASITSHVNCLDSWSLFPGKSLYEQLEREATIGVQVSAELDGAFPLMDAVHMPPPWDACLFYEAIDPPAFSGRYDGAGVPILVIGNATDPFTTLESSWDFAYETLDNGRLVTVSHPNHTVYPDNACVVDYVHAALIDQVYPDAQSRC